MQDNLSVFWNSMPYFMTFVVTTACSLVSRFTPPQEHWISPQKSTRVRCVCKALIALHYPLHNTECLPYSLSGYSCFTGSWIRCFSGFLRCSFTPIPGAFRRSNGFPNLGREDSRPAFSFFFEEEYRGFAPIFSGQACRASCGIRLPQFRLRHF